MVPKFYCFADWPLILEYLKAFLSWPVSFAFVVILLIVYFKTNIASLIDRIDKADFPGGGFTSPLISNQSQVVSPVESPLEAAAEAAPLLQQDVDNTISQDFAAVVEDPGVLIEYIRKNPGPTISEYLRLRRQFNCEQAFNSIFGTQVEILERLASTGISLFLQDIAPYHARYQVLAEDTVSYPLEQYVAWLTANHLLELDPAIPGAYRATTFGLFFLGYIKAQYPTRWNFRIG